MIRAGRYRVGLRPARSTASPAARQRPLPDARISEGKFHRGHSLSRQPLFDHLVGAAEQRQRNGEAERLGGPEIDGHLDFRDLLHR